MKYYEESFALNLKRLRKAAGISQKALAEAAGYSEKTISKWECANNMPDINTLFHIAELLHTNIDEFFKNETEVYLLGIDGGGTKTELALANSDGCIIRTLRSDCCNPFDIGLETAKKVLSDSIYIICSGIALSSVVTFAGIAGGSLGNMKSELKKFFACFKFRAFINDSDNRNTVAAGLGMGDGISLIMGTGICAYAQKNQVRHRVAGWGNLIDNGGSAYNIGRDALNAYYCSIDKSGPESELTREIGKLNPDGEQALLKRIYDEGKKTIASFSPMVFKAADNGDTTAIAILKRNMSEAAHFIETAAKTFGNVKIPVVIAGGLTAHPTMLGYLTQELSTPERYDIKILDCAPVNGAVSLARELYIKIH